MQFDGGTTSTQDIVGLVVDQIHFTADANTISGTTPLGLSGTVAGDNILNDTGTNSIDDTVPLVLSGDDRERLRLPPAR